MAELIIPPLAPATKTPLLPVARLPCYPSVAMSYFLDPMDYEAHNAEVKQVWEAYHAGRPVRVPVILGINPRVWLLNPELNREGVTFEQYAKDPDLMARVQMTNQHYVRHNMLQDAEMGLPKEGWNVYVDSQNCYEAAWFGAEIEYRGNQVPVARPFLGDDNKRMLFDRGIPDPFSDGAMGINWQLYEHLSANLPNYVFAGLPAVSATPAGLGTDGPLTIAASIRGATQICLDIYEDPGYFDQLMRYITAATIHRIKALRKTLGHEMRPKCWGFADDSIELLSVDTYREFVLPYHRMLLDELAGKGPHSIHLCGGVDHLIPVLKRELNLNAWDAGFPVDYSRMRRELGREFQIATGPRVSTLLHGTPAEVEAESRRILESGITDGGRFILRDANNVSPLTPVENVRAMYDAARKYGRYG